nr:hypothetical protein [Tanacetum cinerariifolium]
MKRRLFKGIVKTFTDKSLGEDASKQRRNDDKIEELNLTGGADTEVLVEDKGSGEKLRSEKAKEKGVAFRDVKEPPRLTRSTTTLQPLLTIDPKDKGKGVLVEEEPEKLEKVKRRDQGLAQIESDADLAQRIYEEELAELDRAQKERQKQEEATIAALTEEFNEIQARMDADHELAVRMTHEEQEKYTIKEMARLLVEYFKRRKKQLVAERAEAIRNKPPTRTQVRNRMITYLKHIVVSDEEKTVDLEILSTKYPIVDWESQILGNVDTKDVHVYKIIRADGNTSYHKSLSSMLRKFDRQDLVDLHRLVMKRFKDNTPEGYNLLLWGDLKSSYIADRWGGLLGIEDLFNLILWIMVSVVDEDM